MNKKIIMWVLLGWMASLLYSPTHVVSMVKGSKSG
jgi:lipid-A-disaccharide synthase-like uncharacterized protein